MKHDQILKKIKKRLKSMRLEVIANEEYIVNNMVGEIDVYGIDVNRRRIYAIEVKSKDNPTHLQKALKQLSKDDLYLKELFPSYKILNFYAYSDNNKRGYYIRKE